MKEFKSGIVFTQSRSDIGAREIGTVKETAGYWRIRLSCMNPVTGEEIVLNRLFGTKKEAETAFSKARRRFSERNGLCNFYIA